MGRNGPKSDTLSKVAAAQRLVDNDVSVNQACAQAGISPSAFRRNGGRSKRGAQPPAAAGRKSAGATARAQAMAAAVNDSDVPERNLGDPGIGPTTPDDVSVLRVNDTSTGIDMAIAAAVCDAMQPGSEEIIASRRGMLTIRSPHEASDQFSFEFMDWADDLSEAHSCTMTVDEMNAAFAKADVGRAEGTPTA